ncbi:MAG TPA: malonic semialdehyde reductase [Mycobacteriales bacterium]|nr:malonic semialdehyde reductase [Mycobacteriales bacterium]
MTEVAERQLPVLDEIGRAALFTEAHTANAFAPTPVTDAELAGIWELAKWPPTAVNSQPLRVLYVQGAQARARLVEHLAEGNQAKTLTAPAVAVLAYDHDFHEHIPTIYPPKVELKDVFAADAAARAETAKAGAMLQAGYFLLSIRAHGLAAGPMGGFDAAGVDAEFFPEGRWHSIMVVNIGHPGEDAYRDRLPRLAATEVVRWV